MEKRSKADLLSHIGYLKKCLDDSFNRIDELNATIQQLKEQAGSGPKARMVITIEGALIQSIVSTVPIEVLKIDLDIDDLEAGDTKRIVKNDGMEIEVYSYTNPIEEAEVDRDFVEGYFRQFEGGDTHEEDRPNVG